MPPAQQRPLSVWDNIRCWALYPFFPYPFRASRRMPRNPGESRIPTINVDCIRTLVGGAPRRAAARWPGQD
eukprot:1620417-Pyramimonas_sp.AAC.1